MAELIKRRVQYTVDQGIAEGAEYIMAKAGITPSSLISMLYAQINKTGEIPVKPQASTEDIMTAKLITASYNLPSTVLRDQKSIDDFFDDDGY